MKNLFYLLYILGFVACSTSPKKADLIVQNALIYTVNEQFDTATSMAIKDGKIIGIGDDDTILKEFQADEIYDAQGKTIVPGLIDAHAHLYGYGLMLQNVDLTNSKSAEEALARIQAFHKKNPNNSITGFGWDQNQWPNQEFPNKEMLDEWFPDIPVALSRIDGHALWVNSKALELAGITKNTKISGGEIVLKNGEVLGILIDAPMQLVHQSLPSPNRSTQINALLTAERIAWENGLTTVADAGLDREIVELIDSLQKAGRMKLKVYAMLNNTPANRAHYLQQGIYETDRLNVRSFKIYTDGALGSRGAAMRAPYSDHPHHYGAMIVSADSLAYFANLFSSTDFQMNSHAIGDSANISVLKAYHRALKNSTNKRWRVEHAQIISPQDFHYFSDNILPSVQPTHATSDKNWVEQRIGAERLQGAYAYKTLLEKAGKIALGTDFPVEQVNPMLTFYAAIARKDSQHPEEKAFQIQEALSREEALKGMTIWAAYANFEEQEKGSLEIGKWADFTILDQDLMQIDADRIPSIKIMATFIQGGSVYQP